MGRRLLLTSGGVGYLAGGNGERGRVLGSDHAERGERKGHGDGTHFWFCVGVIVDRVSMAAG